MSSWICGRVVWCTNTNVSERYAASIFGYIISEASSRHLELTDQLPGQTVITQRS
jgi:hypothetical protein